MRYWLRWHRRLGISAALFVIFLSISGLLLNHSVQWGWDRQPVSSRVVLSIYGLDAPAMASLQIDEHWVTQVAGQYLYFNDVPLADCGGALITGVRLSRYWAVICEEDLVLLTPDGELVERVDAQLGLPTPIVGGVLEQGRLLLTSTRGAFWADLDRLIWQPAELDVSHEIRQLSGPPAELRHQLESNYLGHSISWERLLLDLHSGRLLGDWGVLLVDAMAALFVILAITGIWMWMRRSPN